MTNSTRSSAAENVTRLPLHVVPPQDVTDGEIPIGSSDASEGTVETPTRDARVPARARIEPDSAITEREQARRALIARIRERGTAWVRPPDVWAVDRPSLRKQFNYAAWGEQHPETGPLRWLSITLCCLGLIPQAVAYYVAWAAERPGRLLSLYVLLAVVLQIPAVRTVLTAVAVVLTAPLTWL